MSKYVLSESSARRLKEIFNGGRFSASAGGRSSVSESLEFPLPFTVRWASSEGDPGAWIMWTGGTNLVSYNGSAAEITSGAGTSSLSGWVKLSTPSTGGDIWLNVFAEESSAHATIGDSASTGDDVKASMLVATVSRDISTLETSVKQYVTSRVYLTSEGGDGGTVEVDDVSIGKNDDGDIEIKDFHDSENTENTSLAALVCCETSNTAEMIERNGESLKYRKVGRFYSASDSNIQFTVDQNGGVAISVYYA